MQFGFQDTLGLNNAQLKSAFQERVFQPGTAQYIYYNINIDINIDININIDKYRYR